MRRGDEDLWVKKMKEMLSDYTEPVSANGWEQLEKELSPKKRLYPMRWWAAAAVLFAAISTVSLFFWNNHTIDDVRNTSVPELISATPDAIPTLPETDVLTTIEQPSFERVAYVAQTTTRKSESVYQKQEQENTEANIQPDTERNIIEEDTANKETTVKQEGTTNRTMARPSGRDKYHLPTEKTKRTSTRGWSVGVNVNSATLSSNSSASQGRGGSEMMMSAVSLPELSHDLANNGVVDVAPDQTLVLKDGIPYLANSKDVHDIDHHQPISVGVSVRKEIGNKFSLETGLMYTLLSSDIKLGGDEPTKIDQKLHYIGIPLKANWDFVDSKHFNLYLSAGGAVEKCVYGKQGSEKKIVGPLQLSLLGAVGAQYKLSNRVGVYVEPGVSYYFDDGSSVETIRKEKQFNINLQGGIRFTY
ncbi:porin family protein [Bacteroides sp. 224]|uniref:porin family protein n=1 Tax=Bacteroides sp. 224 TaxID=2302936 RepID=UPI0013D42E84|nr:porin family protein [Bacteroides sp. 224]NDV66230.1 PorT family protein [Bacteroides sp. 224]